ncbi:MAG: DUF3575 domain-containing protein [Weeksellaceae bacterium]|nr:DUF3575 domain-containing protein [Weeksellaceae bacterium]
MKKTILLLTIAALCNVAKAQPSSETPTSDRKNDIMISPIELIASPLLNISYERLISAQSGVGINGMFYFGDKNEDTAGFTQVSPYYRMYFGKKYGGGFFVEGFVPITSTKDRYYTYNYYNNYAGPDYHEETRTTVGIGVGFGGKWITRNNIIFEASMGVGRRFGDNDKYDDSNLTGKGMLGIGYRF